MLTLYHAPASRSTSVVQLLHEMAVTDQVRIEQVTISRQDGSGQRDPANPHPEGKVPYLTDGTDHLRERAAIILYLTDRFDSPLGRPVGHPQRGAYLPWLIWYQGVFEPVAILMWAGINHPTITASLRDYDTALARLDEVLTQQPYLLGDDCSAADLLCVGPFAWVGDQMPTTPAVRNWVARCQDRDAARLLHTTEGSQA
ncbi:MAG: glutathione S-transferase N-terminal domain-containing protein [Paracoccus sp. (in: a-proteobacteria)]|uniref:glutathione S-transferase family protein n=1 Tax=Paracoccus sp. TaxID=267 RepID=UPI0026DF5D27|nr:glutathione S-transferase N-terminal domain-containing protein [Paracoccus sp. (in: a-proteobacteria)]MDO5612971.1 glutathione S-transferase N-terminal domain-containing protein [Paracoccus sp. (in: a-proteobacteria)]